MPRKRGPSKGAKYLATNPHPLGRIIAETRRKKGLTQTALAEKSGIFKRTITYYEREQLNPTVATLTRLAEALGVSPQKFLSVPTGEPKTIDRSLRKRFQLAERLPQAARNDIKRYIDNVAKAYGVSED